MPTQADVTAPVRGAWLREVLGSTIGKKVIVAATGVILAAYVVAHAVGNLKVYSGQGEDGKAPEIDRYSEWLRTLGEPAIPRDGALWALRVVLILSLALHVVAVLQLSARNRAARPAGMGAAPRRAGSLSARTMLWGGLLLLAFIVFHILQFTTRTIQVTPVHEGAVYANLQAAFDEWYLVAIYVAAVLLLGFHLRHALWSVAQTGGFATPNRNPTLRRFATGTAVLVTLIFASVPILIFAGVVE